MDLSHAILLVVEAGLVDSGFVYVPKSTTSRDICHTIDGRNPANQLKLVVYPIITRRYTSQVVQDFFHQPYLAYIKSSLNWVQNSEQYRKKNIHHWNRFTTAHDFPTNQKHNPADIAQTTYLYTWSSCSRHPRMPVTTMIITFLVGDPYKPSITKMKLVLKLCFLGVGFLHEITSKSLITNMYSIPPFVVRQLVSQLALASYLVTSIPLQIQWNNVPSIRRCFFFNPVYIEIYHYNITILTMNVFCPHQKNVKKGQIPSTCLK